MKIEDVLKQKKPFLNSFQKVIVNLLYTNSWLSAKQKEFFDQYNLTVKQYNILRILRGAGKPISTAVIRDRMMDKMSDASRIVDRLHKKGLVDKNSCDHDQRKVNVSINMESSKLLTEIDDQMGAFLSSFCGLNKNEAEHLSSLLDKMRI